MTQFRRVVLTAIAATLLTSAGVSAQQISDGQSYLAQNATQQDIFLTRQLRAQSDLVAECAPGSDAASFRSGFNQWLVENPRFRTRPVQLAITAALLDLCKQS